MLVIVALCGSLSCSLPLRHFQNEPNKTMMSGTDKDGSVCRSGMGA